MSSSFRYTRKSKFASHPKVTTLRSHQLYQWYQKVKNTTNTSEALDPNIVVNPTDQTEGGFPKETRAIVHTASFQSGCGATKVETSDNIEVESVFLDESPKLDQSEEKDPNAVSETVLETEETAEPPKKRKRKYHFQFLD